MTRFTLSYSAALPEAGPCLVPGGLATPQGSCTGVVVAAGKVTVIDERHTGQRALLVEAPEGRLDVTWHYDDALPAAYPERMFRPAPSRYTRFADALQAEAGAIAPDLPLPERARAIACATAERFTYGHPDRRFYDGHDAIPALGCGLTEGSCVDINTYFIASLRAAGIEAGYVSGFFFPEEKRDHCKDGHCWVVTRIGGQLQEWDIAHHLKMGHRDIEPGLNPKPGFRVACFHSMGLDFPVAALGGLKVLIEPCRIVDGQPRWFEGAAIRLMHPALAIPEG